MIPRGGTCKSCEEYLLWGDVVRASYRRYTGGTVILAEEPDEEEQDVSSDVQVPKKNAKKRSEKVGCTLFLLLFVFCSIQLEGAEKGAKDKEISCRT